ncbi:FkbM family methyltransferase [Balneatrix alpica]|uniref:FkbM family methyltransferase n=1 Tax=Balneatrix alpica TaxID=75684 RepID=UPI0027386FF2|nr:FkbM family methyltransferase [Balneatrix alpica]
MNRIPHLEKLTQLLVHPSQLQPYQQIFIYGRGKMGDFIHQFLQKTGLFDKFKGFIQTDESSLADTQSLLAFVQNQPRQPSAIIIASSYTHEILPFLFEQQEQSITADIWLGTQLFQDAHYIVDQEVKDFILSQQSVSKRWTCTLDIGANVGKYTTLLSLFANQVHAFEPDPDNLIMLKARAAKLPSQVVINEVGMASTPGVLTLYKDLFTEEATSTTFDPSIASQWQSGQFTTIELPVTSIDHYCHNKKLAPQLIKIDAEGLDLAVLQGGLDTLLTHKPVVVFENNPDHANEFKELFHVLAQHYQLLSLLDQQPCDDWSCLTLHPETGKPYSYNYALVPIN